MVDQRQQSGSSRSKSGRSPAIYLLALLGIAVAFLTLRAGPTKPRRQEPVSVMFVTSPRADGGIADGARHDAR